MDDPPLQKIAISGPTFASLIQRFSTSPSSIEGLLFGHVTHVTPLTLSDDTTTTTTEDSSPALIATVTNFLSSSSFHSSTGTISITTLRHLIPPSSSLLGWFSGRRRTPLRPSMREFEITTSLSSLSQFSSRIKNAIEPLNFNPCLFLILTSPQWDPTSSHVHTQEYRAYQFRCGAQLFEPKSLHIVNIGPDFRCHYEMFSPNSRFPVLDCQFGEDGGSLGRLKKDSEGQREMDGIAEGFEVGRLSKLMGSEAKSYTEGLEDLYQKMLVKIDNLIRLVDSSSAKVLEQENYNRKLKHKILRSTASE